MILEMEGGMKTAFGSQAGSGFLLDSSPSFKPTAASSFNQSLIRFVGHNQYGKQPRRHLTRLETEISLFPNIYFVHTSSFCTDVSICAKLSHFNAFKKVKSTILYDKSC